MLYQNDRHGPAVRFLVQSCDLGARACKAANAAGLNEADVTLDPKNEMWKTLTAHLPKRWELLGDCYLKIDDRRVSSPLPVICRTIRHAINAARLWCLS